MDPRRYSSDPWTRHLGEQADQIKQQQSSSNTSKPSSDNWWDTSKSNNWWDTPQKTNSNGPSAEDIESFFNEMGELFDDLAKIASNIIKGTHDGIKTILDHINPQKDHKVSAAFLTAAIYGSIPVGIIISHNEDMQLKEKHPAIAVAFNSAGKSFISRNPKLEQAKENALQKCRGKEWFSKCTIKTSSTPGKKSCVTYGSIAKHKYSISKYGSKKTTSYNFATVTNKIPNDGELPVKSSCVAQSGYNTFPAQYCHSGNFSTICNYKDEKKKIKKPSFITEKWNALTSSIGDFFKKDTPPHSKKEKISNNTLTPKKPSQNITALLSTTNAKGWSDVAKNTLKKAQKRQAWAIKDIAHFYANGLEGVPKDFNKAEEWATIGSKMGHKPSKDFLIQLKSLQANDNTKQQKSIQQHLKR